MSVMSRDAPSRSRRTAIVRGPAVVALLALAACDAPLVPPLPEDDVYEYRLALSPPETLRWPVGATVRIRIIEGGPDTGALRSALADAMDAWNQHALLDEYRIIEVQSAADADVLLAWSTATLPVNTDQCRPQAGRAQTTFCLDGQHLFTYPTSAGFSSHIRMLVTVGTVLANAPDALDAAIAHEVGHVLGIARHSDVATDLMFTDPSLATPSPRDIATVRKLYRSRADVTP